MQLERPKSFMSRGRAGQVAREVIGHIHFLSSKLVDLNFSQSSDLTCYGLWNPLRPPSCTPPWREQSHSNRLVSPEIGPGRDQVQLRTNPELRIVVVCGAGSCGVIVGSPFSDPTRPSRAARLLLSPHLPTSPSLLPPPHPPPIPRPLISLTCHHGRGDSCRCAP